MRVAHVITRMILGGAQENTLLTCEDLVHEYGDDVLLITGPALGPEGSLMQQARSRGVPLVTVEALRRPIHPWRDLVSYRHVKRVLADFRPEVVHTHSAKGGILGRAAAHALRIAAIVHTVHGPPFYPDQNRAERIFSVWCERWAARRCHALVSVADAMTDLMVDAGVAPREKFTTVYSGMDVDAFLRSEEHRQRQREALGYQADDVVIGKIARLFHLKGHEDVIQAARHVIRAVPQARFLFVGDGVLRDALVQQIASAGLERFFRFTGLVPPQKIPELIAAMDVVVHTSLREGLARALPQALVSGKPVVSYDLDGAREVVLPGETGLIVHPRDIDGLSQALIELAGDPRRRAQYGAEGRRRFTEVFRHSSATAQIRAIYERLLAAAG